MSLLSARQALPFRRSKRSYPDQFWGEVVAYRVGCLLGLQVPPAFAAWNSRTGRCAALIEWFYYDNNEAFVKEVSKWQTAKCCHRFTQRGGDNLDDPEDQDNFRNLAVF